MAQILLVGMSTEGSVGVANLLRGSGHDVRVAADFSAAIRALAQYLPDLLISQVRLGAFNGLHLVIRSHVDHLTMRTILLDSVHDSVLERDAQRYGAAYLVEPVDAAKLLAEVSRKLAEVSPERRWPRQQPAGGLLAHVARRSAHVVDLSYGGLRLELPQAGDVPSRFDVALPGLGVAVRVRSVWTHQAPSGWIWCGAELLEANPRTLAKWRRLVDSVRDAA
jgi:DNA-binding response OmpR family regulator